MCEEFQRAGLSLHALSISHHSSWNQRRAVGDFPVTRAADARSDATTPDPATVVRATISFVLTIPSGRSEAPKRARER